MNTFSILTAVNCCRQEREHLLMGEDQYVFYPHNKSMFFYLRGTLRTLTEKTASKGNGSSGAQCESRHGFTHLDNVAALFLQHSDEAGQVGLVVSACRGARGSLIVVREMNPTRSGGGAW